MKRVGLGEGVGDWVCTRMMQVVERRRMQRMPIPIVVAEEKLNSSSPFQEYFCFSTFILSFFSPTSTLTHSLHMIECS